MALETCKECGEQYSNTTWSCPKCGSTSTPIWRFLLLLAIIIFIGIPAIGLLLVLAG